MDARAKPPRMTVRVGSCCPSGVRSSPGGGLHRDALVLEQALQLARLEHLPHDVAAADELALDVDLRDGGPLRVGLDALAKIIGLEDVDAFVWDTEVIEDLHDLTR